MSESPIYEGILQQAEARAEEILARARAEADEIVAEAKSKAAEAAESERRNTSVRLEGLHMKEESAVRSLERLEELKNNDAAYSAVMKRVNEEFDAFFRSPESRKTLVSWIAQAAYGLGQSEARVSWRMGEKVDESMLREAEKILEEKTGFTVHLHLNPDSHISDWGVMLSSMDEKVYYNNQLDVRLRRMSRDIKKIIQESTCKAE